MSQNENQHDVNLAQSARKLSESSKSISPENLCSVSRRVLVAVFALLLCLMALNLIVAVGNWRLYSRVEKLESNLGLQATPQSQQKSLSPQAPKNSASKSNEACEVSGRQNEVFYFLPSPLCAGCSLQSLSSRLPVALFHQQWHQWLAQLCQNGGLKQTIGGNLTIEYQVPCRFLGTAFPLWLRLCLRLVPLELLVAYQFNAISNMKPPAHKGETSTLFPRRIPRGREVEFPLSTHPIRGVEVENSWHGNP